MTNQPSVSSQVSVTETTAASTKEASGKGTDTSVDTPVLLPTNLGTPRTSAIGDVRRYLCEFLSGQRIIEIPRSVRKPTLEGIILRVHPTQSAEKYRLVWLEKGSLLLYYMIQQTKLLTDRLDIRVVPAMRYSKPIPGDVLGELMVAGHRRIGILSAYPQYPTTIIASMNGTVCAWMQENRDHPQIRFSRSFPNGPYYIGVLVGAIEDFWSQNGRPDFEGGDRVPLSYHSIPASMHKAGDPYRSECLVTTEAVRGRLGLSTQECVVTFQPVFGPSEWLKSATINTVEDPAKVGVERVDMVCPGFVSDCLETLEEIDRLSREVLLEAGGSEPHYVPWGNDVNRTISALEVQVCVLLSGWTGQKMYEDEAARRQGTETRGLPTDITISGDKAANRAEALRPVRASSSAAPRVGSRARIRHGPASSIQLGWNAASLLPLRL